MVSAELKRAVVADICALIGDTKGVTVDDFAFSNEKVFLSDALDCMSMCTKVLRESIARKPSSNKEADDMVCSRECITGMI